jgi:hypothetical protein
MADTRINKDYYGGVLMVLCGIIIALEGLSGKHVSIGRGRLEWRGWLCIAGGIVAFILLGKYTGLLPATFSIVFISALGDRQNTLRGALILSLAVCAVAVTIFWWALGIQFPLVMWGTP